MNERYVCTADAPWTPNLSKRVVHPDAVSTDSDDPYWDHYRCPNCGLKFSVEVPE